MNGIIAMNSMFLLDAAKLLPPSEWPEDVIIRKSTRNYDAFISGVDGDIKEIKFIITNCSILFPDPASRWWTVESLRWKKDTFPEGYRILISREELVAK